MPTPLMCPPNLLEQDLTGKRFVVTGGNSGIGYVTVEQLAKQGAHVILAARRPTETERARSEILQRQPKGSVETGTLDLSSLASVRTFAQTVLSKHETIHGLVNNAGVMNTPFSKTADGFENQLGTNHLGHFLLTELLLPALKKGAPARVVNVSSCFHDLANGREGRMAFDDLHFAQRKYDGWESYAQSKLANVLHAKQLAKRVSKDGITTASVHPGWVRTNLIRHSMPVWLQNLMGPVLRLSGMIEPWEGAQTTLYALLAPEVEKMSGAYFSQTGFYREKSAKKGGWPLHSPNPHAHDDAAAEQLERLSFQMVGLS